ncbi:MAG: alcohol dehydrogenase catalytic domain-containing protein [Candidatus Brockarchaeota archaeon]|nr:alcohol dehydrogenase catalytic domain-containing protein [Candidatus Brockarchaeota archaeon]
MGEMEAVVCSKPMEMGVKRVPIPKPKGNEALIEIRAAAVCRSDVSGYLGKHPLVTYPNILGHECSGIVAEVGPDAKGLEVGQEVAVETFFELCGRCPGCRRGQYNTCKSPKIIGHNVPGAFAEYMLANSDFLHPKPGKISFEEAALAEPLSVAVHAVKRCGIGIGETVAIIGAGAIGLLTLQVAKLSGAAVHVLDVVESKLEVAKGLGADMVFNASKADPTAEMLAANGGEGYDYVIEAVGSPRTLRQTVDLARAGGTIMCIGFSGREADEICLSRITLQEMRLLGILGFCRDYPTSIKLLSNDLVDVKPLITQRFALEEAESAIRLMLERPNEVLRAIVIPGRA